MILRLINLKTDKKSNKKTEPQIEKWKDRRKEGQQNRNLDRKKIERQEKVKRYRNRKKIKKVYKRKDSNSPKSLQRIK